jgi:hypothetical protein
VDKMHCKSRVDEERDSNRRRAFDPYTLSRADDLSIVVYAHFRNGPIFRQFVQARPSLSLVDFPYHSVRVLSTHGRSVSEAGLPLISSI